MVIFNNDTLKEAVKEWLDNPASAKTKYGHISNWDVSKVTNMKGMFSDKDSFNQDISKWDVSNVTDMSYMFSYAESFNQDIGKWDVSKVSTMELMFSSAESFNQDIGKWDVSKVTDMNNMFNYATSFNQEIGKWDVSNVITMELMFSTAESFNQDISKWDVSRVSNMSGMFSSAESFNQDIGKWDVSKVSTMELMFSYAESFNQNIGKWDVSKVSNMSGSFDTAISFNQDIGKWDVSKVSNMGWMFQNAKSFNQDISKWNVSRVSNMKLMFRFAESFNQDISNWKIRKDTNMENMFKGSEAFNHDFLPAQDKKKTVMEYIRIEEIENGCPDCRKDMFDEPLPYTFEAIIGYREENEFRKATLSFDEEVNLRMECGIKEETIYNKQEEVKNGELFCKDIEEVNLLEYVFTCHHCKAKITAYNDDPSLDYNKGDFEKQINSDYNKQIWYDSKKHNNEQISLSIDELIENTRCKLVGKFFSVGYIFLLHDMTFKHRGGPENLVANNIDDMLEADSDNIEHGVQGLSTTIVYTSIEAL